MRTSALALSILALVGAGSAGVLHAKRAACNADNCARAVTGTRDGLQSTHLADCSSFLQTTVTVTSTTSTVTVTPAPTTVTSVVQTVPVFDVVTVTSTSNDVTRATSAEYMKRDATTAAPSSIMPPGYGAGTSSSKTVPTYAAACSGTARYSSACSCGGVQPSTVTSFAMATVTVTATASPEPAVVSATATTTVTTAVVGSEVVSYPSRAAAPCNSIIEESPGNCRQVICNTYPANSSAFGAVSNISEFACAQYIDTLYNAQGYYQIGGDSPYGYCVAIASVWFTLEYSLYDDYLPKGLGRGTISNVNHIGEFCTLGSEACKLSGTAQGCGIGDVKWQMLLVGAC